MSTYSVTIAVSTNVQLTDAQARNAVSFGCVNAGLESVMTSTSRDEPWLRVSGVTPEPAEGTPSRSANDAADIVKNVVAAFTDGLRDQGATITEWHSIEVLSDAEQTRRGQNRAIPPMVNSAELAELAGLTVQRIYQYESERKAGKRDDFPAPVLDGYWLRTVAEHWAKTRKTRPGPAPKGAEGADRS